MGFLGWGCVGSPHAKGGLKWLTLCTMYIQILTLIQEQDGEKHYLDFLALVLDKDNSE